jgi:hypothetical protein
MAADPVKPRGLREWQLRLSLNATIGAESSFIGRRQQMELIGLFIRVHSRKPNLQMAMNCYFPRQLSEKQTPFMAGNSKRLPLGTNLADVGALITLCRRS